jgi:hypothetical protein
MARSSNSQRAERINAAILLIERYSSPVEVATALAAQYSISKRQAYRYVKEAWAIGKQVPIPDQKIAFTVKLSQSLIQTLRQYSQSKGTTWSGRSPERLSWSIALIDSRPRKLAKSTSFWCPTKYGQRIADNNV